MFYITIIKGQPPKIPLHKKNEEKTQPKNLCYCGLCVIILLVIECSTGTCVLTVAKNTSLTLIK